MLVTDKFILRNFLNCYFRNINHIELQYKNNQPYIEYSLDADKHLYIEFDYYSETGRHIYNLPVYLRHNKQNIALSTDEVIDLLLHKMCDGNHKLLLGKEILLAQIKNSHSNLTTIFNQLTEAEIAELYEMPDFYLNESGILTGHQMHPTAKSCVGFTKEELIQYYPEFRNGFQLHYFLVDKNYITIASNNATDTNQLISQYFYTTEVPKNHYIIALHPWQANHIKNLPAIKEMLKKGYLKDLGQNGVEVNATSSIRTIQAKNIPYMLKFSLNISITNSVRMQYLRELHRASAADLFWHTDIAKSLQAKYPEFSGITDPTFMYLHFNGVAIEETAVLFRNNPFINHNQATCLASLCHDKPFKKGNRFNRLIAKMANKYNISHENSTLIWFKSFLTTTIEPLLWLYTHYGIALEAHQQNLIVDLNNDGLPIKSYYRDSQGYYISSNQAKSLYEHNNLWQHFAIGNDEFIAHHFTYYLICNSLFGVINALGVSGNIDEKSLIKTFKEFLKDKQLQWNPINNYLDYLLTTPTLPFKDNLQTKLYDLDELTAPLEQQSIYIEITNPFKE